MAAVWKQPSDEVIKHFIFESLYHGVGISEWERSFLVSIDKQFRTNGTLSQKQVEKLESIYAEKTK